MRPSTFAFFSISLAFLVSGAEFYNSYRCKTSTSFSVPLVLLSLGYFLLMPLIKSLMSFYSRCVTNSANRSKLRPSVDGWFQICTHRRFPFAITRRASIGDSSVLSADRLSTELRGITTNPGNCLVVFLELGDIEESFPEHCWELVACLGGVYKLRSWPRVKGVEMRPFDTEKIPRFRSCLWGQPGAGWWLLTDDSRFTDDLRRSRTNASLSGTRLQRDIGLIARHGAELSILEGRSDYRSQRQLNRFLIGILFAGYVDKLSWKQKQVGVKLDI